MERRKAQLTGGTTFTVSLPKEWATEVGLETGDTLRLYTQDQTLIVEPDWVDDGHWETAVSVADSSGTEVRRTIEALYTTGFEEIALADPAGLGANRREISTTARGFVGLETVEASDTRVSLRSLLDSETVSVEQSTVQLQQTALSMHADAVTAFLDGDGAAAEQIGERDDQVDRLYAMISRHFQRSLVSPRETEALDLDQADLYAYQTTARQLERVADHAEKIATRAAQFDRPVPDTFADEIDRTAAAALGVVERATSSVLGDAAVETAHEALDDRDRITDDLEAIERDLHERGVPDSHLIALVLESLRRTAEYGGNVAETALQTAGRDDRL